MAALPPVITIMSRAAEKAARSLLRDFNEVENLQVSIKGPANFVSAADRRAEQIIHDELFKSKPDIGFLMEEGGEEKGKNPDMRWIIDPLDGTTNFLHGIPHWCISIALEEKDQITAGLILDPVKDEMFWAVKGGGAFMKTRRLRVSGRKDMNASLIATGIPMIGRTHFHSVFNKQLNRLMTQAAGTRRTGSAALDLAYVAAGRVEGYWEYNLSPWDAAAGQLIVKEAGGFVTELDGKTNHVYNGNIVAGNPDVYNSLREILNT